jgi:DNA-binding CsgD family transcriptional regulator
MNVTWNQQKHNAALPEKNKVVTTILTDDLSGIDTAKQKYPDVKIVTRSGLLVNDRFNGTPDFSPYNYINAEAIQHGKTMQAMRKRERKQNAEPIKPGVNNLPLPGTALTRREVEIIVMAAKEYNSGEIADRLDINVRTVETHRKRIMAKTNSKNFIGVVVFALKNNYININDFS